MAFPAKNVTVYDSPVLDVRIEQPNVTLEGYVNCINMTQCQNVTIKLDSPREHLNYTRYAVTDSNNMYRFSHVPTITLKIDLIMDTPML